jgi:hypothetical protein
MQIFKYLNKIESGKSINFDSFCNQLQKQGYDKHKILKIFSVEKRSHINYIVKVIDENLFSELLINFNEDEITNRISAARAGDSHKYPVSQAMVVLWSCKQPHPVVVLNNSNVINTPVELGKYLLIIENQENFLKKQETLQFLKQQFPDYQDVELDIAYGSGNAITNQLNKSFFNHYQHIDCLLDLDIGGLKIFSSLLTLIDTEKLEFLLPPCLNELLPHSKINIRKKDLLQLNKYYEKHPTLRAAITLIEKHKKMLEQELYL